MIRSMLVLLTVLCTVTPKLLIEDGYYWRDYKNKIPGDAVPCGLDNAGEPIYAGQVMHEDKLIGGKIYSNGSDIYYHWYGEQHANRILCSPFPHKFEWIWTNPDEVNKLTGKTLVNAGHEPSYILYFGRLYVVDETTVGKVVCGMESCFCFYVVYGKEVGCKGPFEILVYNMDTD